MTTEEHRQTQEARHFSTDIRTGISVFERQQSDNLKSNYHWAEVYF